MREQIGLLSTFSRIAKVAIRLIFPNIIIRLKTQPTSQKIIIKKILCPKTATFFEVQQHFPVLLFSA
jgi:hypothetical protein